MSFFCSQFSIHIMERVLCNLSSFKVQLVPKYTHQHEIILGSMVEKNAWEKFGSAYWHFHHFTQSLTLMVLLLMEKFSFLFYSFLCISRHTSFAWNFHFLFLCMPASSSKKGFPFPIPHKKKSPILLPLPTPPQYHSVVSFWWQQKSRKYCGNCGNFIKLRIKKTFFQQIINSN